MSESEKSESEMSLTRRLLLGRLSWMRLLGSAGFVYGALVLFGALGSEALIFQPQTVSYRDGEPYIKIEVAPGVVICARYLANPQARWTVLYSHGNAEDLGDIESALQALHRLGFAVFAYDYEGYGHSSGKPSEAGCYRDIEAAYRYLTEQLKVAPESLLLYGRSVGGGPTCYLAERVPHAGLILECTFTSAFRVAIPFPLLPFDRFPNSRRLRGYKRPALIMHGEQDEVVPFKHGQRLFEQLPEGQKQSLFVPKARHNDFRMRCGAAYGEALQRFVASLPH